MSNGAETAQGHTGTYDVKTGIVTMDGDGNSNVLLTQGANGIRGPRLEIDLNTGIGRVLGGADARVHSIFNPSSNDNEN
ncbi:MAG: LptA/OstA family protein [Pseudomonadota bacterium]